MLGHELSFVAFINDHHTLVAMVFNEILLTVMASLEVEGLCVGITLNKERDSRPLRTMVLWRDANPRLLNSSSLCNSTSSSERGLESGAWSSLKTTSLATTSWSLTLLTCFWLQCLRAFAMLLQHHIPPLVDSVHETGKLEPNCFESEPHRHWRGNVGVNQ
jgi:hypothetical protein